MARQRYQVLERIDAGGMAEVFRGVATSIEGFDKTVAIKRVLPNLTRKRRFVRMFLDEARLSLGLNHANIVQVFDLGQAEETYFIVMEYVDGTNLRNVLHDNFRHREPMSISHAVYIMAEVCKGLAYAHAAVDADGRPLNIVHRDVSPPNILLSRQGEVKITDFGLAKAKSQLEHTDPGFVKGKFGYLSPEAAYGEPIDHRTDIFAVGIVLWELLANKRLFQGKTEQKTLSLVRKARIPPLQQHNPSVPGELVSMIEKALARDREHRHSDAGELGEALTHFLFDHQLKVGASDIAARVAALVDDEEDRDSRRGPQIEDLIQAEIDRFVSLDEDDATDSGARARVPAEGGEEAGPLEDPSRWFETDAQSDGSDGDQPSRELKAVQVGAEVTDISTAFPVKVMQQAVAAREDGIDWELRDGESPHVGGNVLVEAGEEPVADVEADTDDEFSISTAIPIDVIETAVEMSNRSAAATTSQDDEATSDADVQSEVSGLLPALDDVRAPGHPSAEDVELIWDFDEDELDLSELADEDEQGIVERSHLDAEEVGLAEGAQHLDTPDIEAIEEADWSVDTAAGEETLGEGETGDQVKGGRRASAPRHKPVTSREHVLRPDAMEAEADEFSNLTIVAAILLIVAALAAAAWLWGH